MKQAASHCIVRPSGAALRVRAQVAGLRGSQGSVMQEE